jgi:hypothetical protein
MVSLADMRLKDLLTVMTSSPICTVAVHMGSDNTLTCTDDLTRLINANEQSRHNTLKPTWQDFVGLKF